MLFRFLLENTVLIFRIAGIIEIPDIIRGRVFLEEILY